MLAAAYTQYCCSNLARHKHTPNPDRPEILPWMGKTCFSRCFLGEGASARGVYLVGPLAMPAEAGTWDSQGPCRPFP